MRWQDHIERALEYQTTHTIEDVEFLIANDFAQLWTAEKSAAVTQVLINPRSKDLSLWLNGGEMEEILTVLLPKAEQWAREIGCARLLTSGRPGWDRVMKPHGFTPVAHICAKELL